MSAQYQVSSKAYIKVVLHAAKYPHLAINGVLLSSKSSSEGSEVILEDAIPMFHQNLYVTPVAEVALQQIEALAEQRGQEIAGYYVAHENFYDKGTTKAPGYQIADKILAYNKKACFVVVDNQLMNLSHTQSALILHSYNAHKSKWLETKYILDEEKKTLEKASLIMMDTTKSHFSDFDNFLDNPKCDWTNPIVDVKILLWEE